MRITPLILNLVLILNTASCNPVPDYSNELVSILFDYEDQNNEATLEWSDETEVTVQLERISQDFCFYKGSFNEDPNSVVLITGCQDELRSIQISSEVFGDTSATTLNGTVEIVQGSDYVDEVVRNTDHITELSDQPNRVKREYVTNPDFERDFPNNFRGDSVQPDFQIPSKLILNLNVYLSSSWRSGLSRWAEKAREVVIHASEMFMGRSLDTKIRLIPMFINFDGDHMVSGSGLDEWKSSVPERYLKKGTVHLLLTYELNGSIGIAYMPSVCDSNNRKAIAISRWNNNAIETAQTFAHEIGHALGIDHDFEGESVCGPAQWDGGNNNQIMNYGRPRKSTWSRCSNSDFKKYYQTVREFRPFCLTSTIQNSSPIFTNEFSSNECPTRGCPMSNIIQLDARNGDTLQCAPNPLCEYLISNEPGSNGMVCLSSAYFPGAPINYNYCCTSGTHGGIPQCV